jgi:outer membrane protein insertion porin family
MLSEPRLPEIVAPCETDIAALGHSSPSCCRSAAGIRSTHPIVLWQQRRVRPGIALMMLCRIALCISIVVACPSPRAQDAQQPAGGLLPKTATATAQILASYQGQNVTSVEIAGRPDLSNDSVRSMFVQQAGQPFDKDKVGQTVTALKTRFQQVQLQVIPEANGVRVLLVLEPAVYFGIFTFPGAERFSYSRLVQVANFPPKAAFNSEEIEQDRQSLVTFFEQEGYFTATVQPEIKIDSEHAIADIVFHVTLNRRARFGVIDIVGTTPQQTAALTHDLQTFLARVQGAAIRPGKIFRRATLTKAAQYLQNKLAKRGMLSAQVKLSGAEYIAATNRADIHFAVQPGPEVKVDIQGAHLWPWTRKALLPAYQGVGVDDESVQEGREALTSYFQAKGFFDVKVDAQFKQANAADTVDYQITKGAKHKVVGVEVNGNSQLKTSDLASRVTVQKSHFLSPGKYSQRLVRASVKNLVGLYQSEGFSDVQVTPTVQNGGGNIRVLFHVTEGPRDIVNSLKIEGADTFAEAQFAPKGLKLATGKPYSQRFVENDRATIVSNYLKAGYLNASFRQTAKIVSKQDSHHIDVVYHITEGPRVTTGSVLTLGRVGTQQRLINQDIASIKSGAPLTLTELLASESRLYDHTGVFDWAEVDPKRDITTQTNEDVLVKVHEGSKNQITYGFGFEIINRGGSVPSGTVAIPNLPPVGLPSTFTTDQKTFYGPRGSFQYTRNNVRGKGESLSFTAFAGRLDQRLAAYYINPNLRWSKWKATNSISFESNQENPIFSSVEELASYQIQRPLDAAKKNTLFLRYTFSQTDLSRVEIPALVPTQDLHVRLSTLAANFTRDTRDNPTDEHKGVLQSVELDFNTTKLGSSVDFAKLTAQSAYYKTISHNIVWANSIRIGLAQPFASSRVPLSEEFFTGGGNSLRGFPLDGAGPQREVPVCSSGSSTACTLIQVPTGGNELLLINSELRVPLPIKKGLGIVGFYDGGSVFPTVGFHDFSSLYSNNVGLGLRYATPVGPVRIDLGRNLNPVPGIGATQYFISIGQAF